MDVVNCTFCLNSVRLLKLNQCLIMSIIIVQKKHSHNFTAFDIVQVFWSNDTFSDVLCVSYTSRSKFTGIALSLLYR